jgi:hypothetical protein
MRITTGYNHMLKLPAIGCKDEHFPLFKELFCLVYNVVDKGGTRVDWRK